MNDTATTPPAEEEQLDLDSVLPQGLQILVEHANQYMATLGADAMRFTTDHVPYIQRWTCTHELVDIFDIIVTPLPYMPFEYSDIDFMADLFPTDEVRQDKDQMTEVLTDFMDKTFGGWMQHWLAQAKLEGIDALPHHIYAPLGMLPSLAMRSMRMVYQRHKDGTAAYSAVGYADMEGYQVTLMMHEPFIKTETVDLGDVSKDD